jgi:aconitase B
MLKGDADALEKLLASELSYTHSNAAVQDKASFISDIKTGKIKYLTIEPSDRKAQVFGNMAIVTGGASVHVIQNGNDLTFKIRYTNAHINRSGSWQMVAWQSTRLPA